MSDERNKPDDLSAELRAIRDTLAEFGNKFRFDSEVASMIRFSVMTLGLITDKHIAAYFGELDA